MNDTCFFFFFFTIPASFSSGIILINNWREKERKREREKERERRKEELSFVASRFHFFGFGNQKAKGRREKKNFKQKIKIQKIKGNGLSGRGCGQRRRRTGFLFFKFRVWVLFFVYLDLLGFTGFSWESVAARSAAPKWRDFFLKKSFRIESKVRRHYERLDSDEKNEWNGHWFLFSMSISSRYSYTASKIDSRSNRIDGFFNQIIYLKKSKKSKEKTRFF